MTRAEALEAYRTRRLRKVDWDAVPLEIGMGGCPWRIAVAVIVRGNSSVSKAAAALRLVLARWGTPGLLAEANLSDLGCALADTGITQPWRRARFLLDLARAWTRGEWETVLDLPHVGRTAVEAMSQFGARQ